MRIALLLLFLATAAGHSLPGQPFPTNAVKPGDPLYEEMAKFDADLFEGFNSCKLDEFALMFEEGVEFFHDQTGLSVGVAKLTEQLQANICGKVRRELISGSLTVYPMHGYGALLVGRHRFYQTARGPEPTGVAQFIHLVRKTPEGSKISRVISFDHVGLTPAE